MIRADETDQGIVDDGSVYEISRMTVEFSTCSCIDGKHAVPVWWHEARWCAALDARAIGPRAHMLRRVTATTKPEVEA